MSSFDERAVRTIDLLGAAWPRFVSYAELAEQGIDRPAQTVYELELAGHAIEHSAGGVRLEAGAGARSRHAAATPDMPAGGRE